MCNLAAPELYCRCRLAGTSHMYRLFISIFAFLFAIPCRTIWSQTAVGSSATAQVSYSSYYVRNGDALQLVNGDPARENCTQWQIWLLPASVRVSRYGVGLAYARWGVIDGPSAKAVAQQLEHSQEFERAYTNFFGANAWGRFTFAYPVGPIAMKEDAQENDLLRSRINLLNHQLESVVSELHGSLVNGEPNQAPLVQQDFEQLRESMQDVARFYDKLSRLPAARSYLNQIFAILAPGVERAENAVPRITAILPTVKLPLSKDWMTQAESAGSDGTINVAVKEMDSSAWVQQSWTGGDGRMAGTKIITIVPYQNIGTLDISMGHFGKDARWTLRIQPENSRGFIQSITSPERHTVKRTYPAVDLKTTDGSVYLDFSDISDAQNAYAFFLYHKERGT